MMDRAVRFLLDEPGLLYILAAIHLLQAAAQVRRGHPGLGLVFFTYALSYAGFIWEWRRG